jgi:alkylation response protein AidB-like acyl-CoA dehydrogenase
MDFRLTDEQLALQETVRTFCEREHPLDALAVAPGDLAHADRWTRLAALDVFRVAAPEAWGGLGLGVVDAAVVLEVLGAHLVAGPLVWSALAPRFVEELASGTRIVGGVEAAGSADAPVLVEHPHHLDALLVVHPDHTELVDPASFLSIDDVEPTDPLTPMGLVPARPAGGRVLDATATDDLRTVGTVLAAAQLVGLADRAVTAGVAYAGAREQFGRVIGSFQAIKHLLADCYVRTALARSATYAAAAMVDDPGVGDAARAASGAKLLAADAAVRNARTCIQVHGGMGFTWEMIPHHLLKRAWVLEHTFGTRHRHEDHLAHALEQETTR